MRSLDDEREYLEGLLNRRFNYYLVFVSLIMVAGFGREQADRQQDAFIFGFGFVVSALMAYSVARTRALLQVVLDVIIGKNGAPKAPPHEAGLRHHPYRVAYLRLKNGTGLAGIVRFNANTIIVLAVVLITLFFLVFAIRASLPA